MHIDSATFEDPEEFERLIPAMKANGVFTPEHEHEVRGVRAYALRVGRNPVALFLAKMKKNDFLGVEQQDWDRGSADFGGDPAVGSYMRDQLLEEVKKYIGSFLPGGHEVLSVGIEHTQHGLLSWEKVPLEELRLFAKTLRAGTRGPAPQRMSMSDFILEELGPEAIDWTADKITKELEKKARREDWDKHLVERRPRHEQDTFRRSLQNMDRMMADGTWPRPRPKEALSPFWPKPKLKPKLVKEPDDIPF